jgi:hypothetical protein
MLGAEVLDQISQAWILIEFCLADVDALDVTGKLDWTVDLDFFIGCDHVRQHLLPLGTLDR